MGQTTSCAGKRGKKTLAYGTTPSADTDEPPHKKRKNSRRNSRIFPSAEKENEANNAVNGSIVEDTFNVENNTETASEPVGLDITSKLQGIQFIDEDQEETCKEICAINNLENSPFHEISNKLENCEIGDGKTCETEDTQAEGDALLVEKRQLEILTRLATLQKEVQTLANDAGVTLPTFTTSPSTTLRTDTVSSVSQQPLSSNGTIHDIVVSADPTKPPLSLFVLYEKLKAHYKLIGRVHTHSSITSVPDNLKSIFDNEKGMQRSNYEVAVTVIWKKVDLGPTLIVSGHSQTPIIGESNILRYLGRLLSYDQGDALETTLIDDWIDTANYQILNGKPRERTSAIKTVNSKLGSSDWLVGSDISLADIAVWSSLKQAELTKSSPQNVVAWMEKLSNRPEFQRASLLIK